MFRIQDDQGKNITFIEGKVNKMFKAGEGVVKEIEASKLREQSLVRGVHGLVKWARQGAPPDASMFPQDPSRNQEPPVTTNQAPPHPQPAPAVGDPAQPYPDPFDDLCINID